MARITALCLLLLTTSLHHDVMGFAVRKRHSRSTDLADALRMLERQRSRLDKEQNMLNRRGLTMRDVEPWLNAAAARVPGADDDERTAWLARAVGLDGDDDRGFDDVIPAGFPIPLRDFPREPPAAAARPPVEVEPTDSELDALFGEKNEEDETKKEKKIPMDMEKKDKEMMTAVTGDFGPKPKAQEEALTSRDDALATEAADLTRDEFRALLKAVEKLQKQALLTAAKENMEEEQVAEEVEEKLAEARQEAQTDEAKAAAVEAVAREAAKEAMQEAVKEAEIVKEVVKEAEEAKEAIKEAEALTPKPQPVSKAELDSLFDDQKDEVKEVIHTGTGEIVKTKEILRDAAGRPVGQEEKVEQVEVSPDKDGALSSIEDIWYLRNYLNQDQDGERKKRNSKRSNPFPPPAAGNRVVAPGPAVSVKAGELLQAQVAKINELQSELDQARLVAYLEDLENDILTDALNEATIAQVKGHINPHELLSLQDAIRVEEALQQVKVNRDEAADLAQDLSQKIADQFGAQKRGEPWREKDDVTQSEVPVALVGDDDIYYDTDGEEEEEEGQWDDQEGKSRALAAGRWLRRNPKERMALEELLRDAPLDTHHRRVASVDELMIRESQVRPIASLFTEDAVECPAVREFSSNCIFAGGSIDYEAKALCNMHEMCYMCGKTLEVAQGQCDFIYRDAVTMLCQGFENCLLESEVFLNSMKLKHRYVPYSQEICRSKCVAQFLSII